jgi:hypothetical protein
MSDEKWKALVQDVDDAQARKCMHSFLEVIEAEKLSCGTGLCAAVWLITNVSRAGGVPSWFVSEMVKRAIEKAPEGF